jgi:Pyruvate/2-oxoacid:ferredoxin oxidoreductase delta subunit
MAMRKMVKIDEEKCNGCGLCIPNCVEGALQIVDGKAKLMSDKFCDGLGACLGHCPQDAITIAEREAEEFDEKAVGLRLHKKNKASPKPQPKPEPAALFTPHPVHRAGLFGEKEFLHPSLPSTGRGFLSAGFTGCPSSRMMYFKVAERGIEASSAIPLVSMLSQWPVQLKLVPINAPYFRDADLLVVADCVPFAYANFHQDFLKGKAVVVGCPKLDDIQYYREKLTEIFKANPIKSVTVLYMEVPCCFGLVKATEEAIKASGKSIPLKKVKIGIHGEIQPERGAETTQRPRTALHLH